MQSHGPNFCSRCFENILTITEIPGFMLPTEEIRGEVISKKSCKFLCWQVKIICIDGSCCYFVMLSEWFWDFFGNIQVNIIKLFVFWENAVFCVPTKSPLVFSLFSQHFVKIAVLHLNNNPHL